MLCVRGTLRLAQTLATALTSKHAVLTALLVIRKDAERDELFAVLAELIVAVLLVVLLEVPRLEYFATHAAAHVRVLFEYVRVQGVKRHGFPALVAVECLPRVRRGLDLWRPISTFVGEHTPSSCINKHAKYSPTGLIRYSC